MAVWFSAMLVVPQSRRWPASAVHAEFPQGVPVLGGPGRAVHPDVAAAAGDVQRLVAAGPGGGGVDGGPGRAVGRRLDLERGGVGGLPVQGDLADGLDRAEIDLQPLRVGERAGPAGTGVAVDRVGRRVPAFSIEDAVAVLFSARFVVPQLLGTGPPLPLPVGRVHCWSAASVQVSMSSRAPVLPPGSVRHKPELGLTSSPLDWWVQPWAAVPLHGYQSTSVPLVVPALTTSRQPPWVRSVPSV